MLTVVGLQREREVLTVALQAGRHVLIEGPPGTGKSTLLRGIASDTGQRVVFVEGNAELTPARLVGQYDPAQVLAGGYAAASFTDGPLLQAMRDGALLYLEEFNRIPEETLNVLITVLAEGEIAVPRLGPVRAEPGFRLIAAMNPFDAIGTARVSQAIADRICRVVLGYPGEAAEREITTAVTRRDGPVVGFAVTLARATRDHRDVRMGASVRGAIDLTLLLAGLARLRGEPAATLETGRDAAYAALSGRIRIADGCQRSPESVLDELLGELWPGELPVGTGDLEEDEDGSTGGAGSNSASASADDAGESSFGESSGDDESAGQDESSADGSGAESGPGGPASPPGRGGEQDGRGKAEGLPPAAAGRPAATSGSSLRRDRRARGGGRRTFSRAELSARHAGLPEVSPAAGQVDADALARLLAADPDAAATLLADLSRATDPQLRAAARRLAARIFVELGTAGPSVSRGTRRLGPSRRSDGDLDLDRTLDRLSGAWPPSPDELVTSSWHARRRALCLLIDTSGSMTGLAVAICAVAAAGVVLATEGRLDPAIIAFGGDHVVLQRHGAPRPPEDLVSDLIGLHGHGMTDVAGALRAAAAQLAEAADGERVAILLSDCLHTAGGEPALALAGIDRLHVLCPLPTAESERAAAALARSGGGFSQPVRGVTQVAPALNRALSSR